MHIHSLCSQCMDCLKEKKIHQRKMLKKDRSAKSHRKDQIPRLRSRSRCRYCSQKSRKTHVCPEKYIYELILEPFFKRVFLDTQPFCYLDLYQNCIKVVRQEELFKNCSNIKTILHYHLRYYIEDYEFWSYEVISLWNFISFDFELKFLSRCKISFT